MSAAAAAAAAAPMSLSDIASRALGGTGVDNRHSAGVSRTSNTEMGRSLSMSDLARAAFQGMGGGISVQPPQQHQQQSRSHQTGLDKGTMSASQTMQQLQQEQQMATPPTSLLSMNTRHGFRQQQQLKQRRGFLFNGGGSANSHLPQPGLNADAGQTRPNQQAFRSELFDSFNSRLRSDAASQFGTILNRAEAREGAQEAKAREVGGGERVPQGLPSVSISSSPPVDPTLSSSSGGDPFAGQMPPPSGVKYTYGSNEKLGGSGLPPPPPPPSTPPPPRMFGSPPPVSSPYALRHEMEEQAGRVPAPIGEDGIDHSFLPRAPVAKKVPSDNKGSDDSNPQGAPAIAQTIPI